MKKNLLLIFVVSVSICVFAQSKSDKMYDVFDNRDGVLNFSFSKSMLSDINLKVENNGDEKRVTGDLQRVRFMSYNPKKGKLSGSQFIEKAVGYLPKSVYKYYQSEDEDNTDIWLKGKKRSYEECHVFIKNHNDSGLHFIVSFFGDFKVEDINDLKIMSKGFSN